MNYYIGYKELKRRIDLVKLKRIKLTKTIKEIMHLLFYLSLLFLNN